MLVWVVEARALGSREWVELERTARDSRADALKLFVKHLEAAKFPGTIRYRRTRAVGKAKAQEVSDV